MTAPSTTAVAAPRLTASVLGVYEPDPLAFRTPCSSTFAWYLHDPRCTAPLADRTEGVECPGCVAVECRWEACSGSVTVQFAGLARNDADPRSMAVTTHALRGAFILAIETARANGLVPRMRPAPKPPEPYVPTEAEKAARREANAKVLAGFIARGAPRF